MANGQKVVVTNLEDLEGISSSVSIVGVDAAVAAALASPARRIVSVSFLAAAAGDYAAGDVISNSVTDTLGLPLYLADIVDTAGQAGILDKIVIKCSEDSLLCRFRFHFYADMPLPAEVEMDDNIAFDWAKTTAGANKYIGPSQATVAMADGGTAMSYSSTINLRDEIKTTVATGVWAVMEILDIEANEAAGMRFDIDFYFLN